MDNHADASEVYTKLVRLNGVGYEVFELPSGPFFLFADDLALRMAAFEGSIDEKDLSRVIPRRRNAPIRAALKFLDSYLHGMKAPLPPLDLSAYTGAEKAVYRSLMAVPFGRTISYADLARRAGFGRGARFAETAWRKTIFRCSSPATGSYAPTGVWADFRGAPGSRNCCSVSRDLFR